MLFQYLVPLPVANCECADDSGSDISGHEMQTRMSALSDSREVIQKHGGYIVPKESKKDRSAASARICKALSQSVHLN
jgi:hypothetical protein